MTDRNNIRVIEEFASSIEAGLVADQLRDAGIAAHVRASGAGSGAFGGAEMFGYELLVREDQVDDALRLLGEDASIPEAIPQRSRPTPRANPRVLRK